MIIREMEIIEIEEVSMLAMIINFNSNCALTFDSTTNGRLRLSAFSVLFNMTTTKDEFQLANSETEIP